MTRPRCPIPSGVQADDESAGPENPDRRVIFSRHRGAQPARGVRCPGVFRRRPMSTYADSMKG
jgi:hypothetical protein